MKNVGNNLFCHRERNPKGVAWRSPFLVFYFILLFVFIPFYAFSASPLINETTTSDDVRLSVPPVWDNSSSINYHIEPGACGPFSNEEMVAKFETLLTVWSDIDTVDLTLSGVTGSLGEEDITDSNFETYFYINSGSADGLLTDNINPILFDDDGAIVSSIYGEGNEYLVLGFAGITEYENGEILDGQAVINCKCLEDHPTEDCIVYEVPIVDSEDDINFTIVHEMGHFLNLGHSSVNTNSYMAEDYDEGDIPIMFPIASGMTNIQAHEDDVLALTQLYPDTSVSDHYCVVTGYLVDSTGENYVPCVDVWAVTGDDPTQTLSYVTASNNEFNTSTASDFDLDDACDEYCGYFALNIKPGTAYTLYVYDVYPTFTGGSSVGPCVDEQPEYGLEGVAIATISADDCSLASSTPIDLGTITLDVTVTSSTDSGGNSGSGGDDSNNPVGYGCGLSVRCSVFGIRGVMHGMVGVFLILLAGLVIIRNNKYKSIDK